MSLVLAVLHREATVVHDIRLIGDTGVAHQIDVRLLRNSGEKHHILIECKDFDVSGDSVGLPIVRNFWGVVDDVRPDQAWVITCTGFTPDAQRYARGKGIKLATLRAFHENDWHGRIQTIEIQGQLFVATDFKSSINFDAKDEKRAIASQALGRSATDYNSPVSVILKDGSREQINRFLEGKMKAASDTEFSEGCRELDALEPGLMIQYGDADPIAPRTFTLNYYLQETHSFTVTASTAGQLARLLLTPLDDHTDYVIMDEEIREFTIDSETGEVRRKNLSAV